MRTFLAVFPPPDVQAAARRAIDRLRRAGDEVAWVRQENLHYTLRFMGELGEDEVTRLVAAVSEGVRGRAPFDAALGAAGAFPNARRARVLWLGLVRGGEELTALARGVEQALVAHGFAGAERPFSPHLTIGRVRRRDEDWSGRLADAAPGSEPAPGFRVDRVIVVRSTLAPGGSIYRPHAEAALSA